MRFLVTYRSLALAASRSDTSRWRLRPTFHYLHHVIQTIRDDKVNVLFSTCFLDEDFMGKVKKLASRTHRARVGERTLQRYVLLLAVRWARIKAPRLSGTTRAEQL